MPFLPPNQQRQSTEGKQANKLPKLTMHNKKHFTVQFHKNARYQILKYPLAISLNESTNIN